MNNIFEKFKIKKIGLGIAIIVVFNLFIAYGIQTFYETPKHDDFCKREITTKNIHAKDECEAIGGLWTENMNYRTAIPPAPTVIEGIKGVPTPESAISEPVGWCDAYFTCQKEFNEANDIYKRNVFIVWIIAGVIAIAVSFFWPVIENMSVTFIFAGLISLFVGTIGYWSAMRDYLRFIILGVALAVLIYAAYKKMKND